VATICAALLRVGGGARHDPEKCEAVFRKDHAQTKAKRDDQVIALWNHSGAACATLPWKARLEKH